MIGRVASVAADARRTFSDVSGSYRGLFVGIDTYVSEEIRWLRFAEPDARALHALFADTFGPGGELLCGAAATRQDLKRLVPRLPLRTGLWATLGQPDVPDR